MKAGGRALQKGGGTAAGGGRHGAVAGQSMAVRRGCNACSAVLQAWSRRGQMAAAAAGWAAAAGSGAGTLLCSATSMSRGGSKRDKKGGKEREREKGMLNSNYLQNLYSRSKIFEYKSCTEF